MGNGGAPVNGLHPAVPDRDLGLDALQPVPSGDHAPAGERVEAEAGGDAERSGIHVPGERVEVPAVREAPKTIRLVIIESPYAGDIAENVQYLIGVIRECALRGDSPYASHLMLTDALDDSDPVERQLGISLGLEWRRRADARLFYVDRGWSRGMLAARKLYLLEGLSFEVRTVDESEPLYVIGQRSETRRKSCRHVP